METAAGWARTPTPVVLRMNCLYTLIYGRLWARLLPVALWPADSVTIGYKSILNIDFRDASVLLCNTLKILHQGRHWRQHLLEERSLRAHHSKSWRKKEIGWNQS